MGHESNKSSNISSVQQNSATLIQSFWRRHHAKKNYGVKQLPESQRSTETTFLVGNDPKITGLEPYVSAPHEKIALIGASGLRSLALICRVGNKETIPKLIIVDNSKHVVTFWRGLRTLVEKRTYQDKNDFLTQFQQFLMQNQILYKALPDNVFNALNIPNVVYENQNPILFLEHLINSHGLAYICSLIKKTTILGQSWGDKTLFVPLKNILKHNGIDKIYIYPSNIAHCVALEEFDDFIENLQKISPYLSIMTDCCPSQQIPKSVTLSTEIDAEHLKINSGCLYGSNP